MTIRGMRILQDAAKKIGVQLVHTGMSGGGHIKACVRTKDGREGRMFFSATPSNRDASRNVERQLRHFAKGDSCGQGAG